MIKIKKHYFVPPSKSKWNNMVTTSVYQTPFVQRKLAMSMPVYCVIHRYIPIYYEIIENGETMMIVPLCKYVGENRFCNLGNVNGFQLFDIVYRKGLTEKRIDELLAHVLDALHLDSIEIVGLPENAQLYHSITRLAEMGELSVGISCSENVSISGAMGYEHYYQSLSKNNRQNLRTAYNRMNRDCVRMQFEVITGRPVPRNAHKELMEVYYNRHTLRYGVATSKIKRFYLLYFDFSTKCLQKHPQNFNAVLYLNGEIAAFMSGLKDGDRDSVIIPRLSINDKYYKYSPGVVLINETMKYIIEDMDINVLDLSKGAEQYKLSMGGTIYPTYSLKIYGRENVHGC